MWRYRDFEIEVRAMQEPAYIRMYESGKFEDRVERALSLLEDCRVCPRDCSVNRARG